jgi:metal-sulfur cluster biosynthetic enzyme
MPAEPPRDDPAAAPFPYTGPDELRGPVARALAGVVDPELALDIVDVGLVYGVTIDDARVHVLLTMTTAACPVTEVIVRDVEDALDRAVPGERRIAVELVWEPPWTVDRLSGRARRFLDG